MMPAVAAGPGLVARHTREQKPLHVVIAVERLSEGIDAAEACDGKAGLKPQKLGDVGNCLLGPAKMAQGGDQGLIAVDKVRIGLGGAAPDNDGLFVVAFEKIGDRVKVFPQWKPRIGWGELAVAVKAT